MYADSIHTIHTPSLFQIIVGHDSHWPRRHQSSSVVIAAAELAHLDLLAVLTSSGASVDDAMVAMFEGFDVWTRTKTLESFDDTFKELLEHRHRIQYKADFRDAPLTMAVVCDRVRLAERMLQAGADPNSLSKDGQSALYVAADKGSVVVVQLLLDHKADPDVKDRRGQTPLMRAVYFEHDIVVFVILENGNRPHVDTFTNEGNSAFMFLQSNGMAIAKMLWDKGYDIDHKNKKGESVFSYVMRNNTYVEVIFKLSK